MSALLLPSSLLVLRHFFLKFHLKIKFSQSYLFSIEGELGKSVPTMKRDGIKHILGVIKTILVSEEGIFTVDFPF